MFPTHQRIDSAALLHNVRRVREYAPHTAIIAMIKANAYGCGLSVVAPLLDGAVEAFGVAHLEEALSIHHMGVRTPCVIFRSFLESDSWHKVLEINAQCVIYHEAQLQSLLQTPLLKPLTVWVKINTGMNRAGFSMEALPDVISALKACPWVSVQIGLMTHFASADIPDDAFTTVQLEAFQTIQRAFPELLCSLSNSAAIMAQPLSHADYVRPGLMLYGVSPFADKTGQELGLSPVVRFYTKIESIQSLPAGERVGYHGIWQSTAPARIGLLPVGYGDGYPRSIAPNTPVYIHGRMVPIVGRVSMDIITVDLTHCEATLGDEVELWGEHLPIEHIARLAGTIPYTLLTGLWPRHISES